MSPIDDKIVLDIRTQEDVMVVSLDQSQIGPLCEIDTLAETLRGVIRQEQPRNVVIDFSRVRFFSSQMLGLLVDIWRRMKDTGGQLLISGINPQLVRVFHITHLDKLFALYDDTDAAVAALGG